MIYSNKFFQDIVICNEIWHVLKVSQDMEYIFCVLQRVRNLIFFQDGVD